MEFLAVTRIATHYTCIQHSFQYKTTVYTMKRVYTVVLYSEAVSIL